MIQRSGADQSAMRTIIFDLHYDDVLLRQPLPSYARPIKSGKSGNNSAAAAAAELLAEVKDPGWRRLRAPRGRRDARSRAQRVRAAKAAATKHKIGNHACALSVFPATRCTRQLHILSMRRRIGLVT